MKQQLHLLISFLTFSLFGVSAVFASPSPVSELWDPSVPMPSSAETRLLEGVTFKVIKPHEPEVDGYHWLHGASIIRHKGIWHVTWGHNKGHENTKTEVAQGRRSTDGFKTLTPVEMIAPGTQEDANSHGVTLSLNGELWGFFGRFTGKRQNAYTEAYKLNEKIDKWESQGIVMGDGFWPMDEPKRMDNGNYVVAGFRMSVKNGNPPAVAISNGDDMLDWTVVRIPKPAKLKNMWGESSVIVHGKKILCIVRNHRSDTRAYVSVSDDFGKTWSPLQRSNMPMAATKPFAGTLSNGRDYLISSTTTDNGNNRYPLTIALTDPGGGPFNRVCGIRNSVRPGENTTEKASLAYPYAVEEDGHLYVVYSVGRPPGNRKNVLELAIIPLSSLDKADVVKPDVYPLWSGPPAPKDPADLPEPEGLENSVIHRPGDKDYKFLHGAAITHHEGVIYANWANSPTNENGPHETLRGRRSKDGGKTWSALEVVAPGFDSNDCHSHGVYHSDKGELWAFCARFDGSKGKFPGLTAEAFVLNTKTDKWESRGIVMDNCWPYDEPVKMANGNYITGGQDKKGLPVVAISQGDEFAKKWQTVPIPYDPALKPNYAETTVWADDKHVIAVIRGGGGVAWVSTSDDFGQTWTRAKRSNLAMPRAKAYLGKLSTGQLYLVHNVRNRDTLVVSVSKPGESTLRKTWRIRHGSSNPVPRFKGSAKSPQWSYPYAHEHDGKLYIVYSIGKEECGLSVIPVASLKPE